MVSYNQEKKKVISWENTELWNTWLLESLSARISRYQMPLLGGFQRNLWCGSDIRMSSSPQGPCIGNQQSLAHSRLWDAVVGFLHVFANMQMKLSQVLWPIPCTCHCCEMLSRSSLLGVPIVMWLFDQRLDKSCILGLSFFNWRPKWETETDASRGSQTGFCMNAASFFVSHQPTVFTIASTFAFYGANPFCFLVTVLSTYEHSLPAPCVHLSHVACLCNPHPSSLSPLLPSSLPPCLCLSFSLPISLARWIRTAQSIYYEQINVAYVAVYCLSPWQHLREAFRRYLRLIRVTFVALTFKSCVSEIFKAVTSASSLLECAI